MTIDSSHDYPAPLRTGVWCREREAWHFVLLRYAPALGAFHLLWEFAQLPLYTIWTQAPPGFIVYAVLHCTASDMLIGVGALLAALVVTRAGSFHEWPWVRVGVGAVIFGVVYTAFSEWMNTAVRASWAYSEWMPVLPGVSIGLSPLLQWMLMPPAALALARRIARPRGKRPEIHRDSGERS